MKKVFLFLLLGVIANQSVVKAQAVTFSTESAITAQPKVVVYHNTNSSLLEAKVDVVSPGNYTLEVFNLLGQRQVLVYNGNIEKGRSFFTTSTEFWPQGIYLVKLSNGKTGTVKKIVIQKP